METCLEVHRASTKNLVASLEISNQLEGRQGHRVRLLPWVSSFILAFTGWREVNAILSSNPVNHREADKLTSSRHYLAR